MTAAASWPRVRLGDIGQSLIGLTYSPSNVKRSGTLVLRSSNIQGGSLAFDDNVYVDSVIPEKIRVRENDILICVRNGSRRLIGKSVLLDSRVAGETFGAFMAVYRSDANPFLRYFFQSDDFKAQIDEHLGATINQITNGSLNSFTVALPDAVEQAEIVAKLSDVDDLIATLERLISKKQSIKRGMMQQLLTGRTRLPGFKCEWSGSTVGEVSEFLTGYPFKSESFAAAGIRLIRGSNVKRGEIDWSPEIAMYWAQCDPGLRAVTLRAGDIVIAMDGALVGRSFARITDAELPAYLVQRVARLRGKAIDQDFLYQWIGSQAFAKHVDDVKTHTAIPHISPRDIRDFKILTPLVTL